MRLLNKVIIITGASSGIGKAMSLLFVKNGATVMGVARREDKLDEVVVDAEKYKGKFISINADITKIEDIDHIVDYTIDKFKRVDVLVNNAGIMDDFSPVGEVSDEMINKVSSINILAPIKLSRKVLPIMLEQAKGNIINIASIGGLHGARAGVAFTTSKHALVGLTKNTAFMYAEKGIRANAICPGGVDTSIADNIAPNEFGMARVMKGVDSSIRTASVDEIANIGLFLASDESDYINGDTIVADAGWTAY